MRREEKSDDTNFVLDRTYFIRIADAFKEPSNWATSGGKVENQPAGRRLLNVPMITMARKTSKWAAGSGTS